MISHRTVSRRPAAAGDTAASRRRRSFRHLSRAGSKSVTAWAELNGLTRDELLGAGLGIV
jgi:hypothetical protein